jgi:hypothetical protein
MCTYVSGYHAMAHTHTHTQKTHAHAHTHKHTHTRTHRTRVAVSRCSNGAWIGCSCYARRRRAARPIASAAAARCASASTQSHAMPCGAMCAKRRANRPHFDGLRGHKRDLLHIQSRKRSARRRPCDAMARAQHAAIRRQCRLHPQRPTHHSVQTAQAVSLLQQLPVRAPAYRHFSTRAPQ